MSVSMRATVHVVYICVEVCVHMVACKHVVAHVCLSIVSIK